MSDGLLLDTHVWVWLLEGSRELTGNGLALLERAAAQGELRVSAISVWEVATLARKGRLNFSVPLGQWVQQALTRPGVQLVPLSPEVSVETAFLQNFHGDPADRILVATARLADLTLATRDSRILQWAGSGQVRVLRV